MPPKPQPFSRDMFGHKTTRLVDDLDPYEYEIHVQCAELLEVEETLSEGGTLGFHYPAGGLRKKAEAAQLKAMGTRAGMPDLNEVHRGLLHGFEVKRARRYFSKVQRSMHGKLAAAGAVVHPVEIRSLEELIAARISLGLPATVRDIKDLIEARLSLGLPVRAR
jgi:hypothetical protein